MTTTTPNQEPIEDESERAHRSLTDIFLAHKDNLSDKWEHYLAIYDAALRPMVAQRRPLRLLEIGVQNGGSLQVWAKYLPRGSRIIGIDIDPACAQLPPLGDSIQVLVGDGSSTAELDRLLGGSMFDIIVDDGSHRSDHIIQTFRASFHRLAPGGIYVVEDLHASYLSDFGGGFGRPESAIEWLKLLADTLNFDHIDAPGRSKLDELLGFDARSLAQEIARVSFYDSVAIVEKLNFPRNAPYRRIMSGSSAPVSGGAPRFEHLPTEQLGALLLAPEALQSFGPKLLGMLASAKEEAGALRSAQADSVQQLDYFQQQLRAVEHDAHARTNALGEAFSRVQALAQEQLERTKAAERTLEVSRRALETTESQLAAATAKLNAAEAQLHEVLNSTSWRASKGVRALGSKLPSWARVSLRRATKVAWWTASGQLPARLRSRRKTMAPAQVRAAESGSDTPSPPTTTANDAYQLWCDANDRTRNGLGLQRRMAACLPLQPKFSVLVPAFKTPMDVFEPMLESILEQSYSRWQLCLAIVDTGPDAKPLIERGQRLAAADERVQVMVLPENRGISGNSNEALSLANGEWVVLVDHDDLLTPDALFELARAINRVPDANFIYSDKDMISRHGERRFNPFMKGAWSPDIMLTANYLTHVCAIPTQRIRDIGGWDSSTDGAQDWDLFLRAIGRDGKVVHVPRVLYHWRVIETSVAAGGFEAKPYAAAGQLRTLLKHLPVAGWPGAKPRFDHGHIRIEWSADGRPRTLVVACGGKGLAALMRGRSADLAELRNATGAELYAEIDAIVTQTSAAIVVLIDAALAPKEESWVDEMTLPLSNPELAMVAGRVLDGAGNVLDFGTFLRDGVAYPAFRGLPKHYFIPGGSPSWYGNASAAPGSALAFRKADWSAVGGFRAFLGQGRPDLAFTLAVLKSGGRRLLLNPFATFHAGEDFGVFENSAAGPLPINFVRSSLPLGDPYISPVLDISTVPGVPTLPAVAHSTQVPAGHDFAAEARYVAGAFDASAEQIQASMRDCAGHGPGPLRRICWIIPSFTVPFYGGIYTILRSAEYMRAVHSVMNIFVVLGDANAEETRARIGLAFPELAADASIHCMMSPRSEMPELGPLDAAVATLWTTAFVLLKLRSVRRKFYFVQDWEPLFYPAGSVSTAVEATYRFGFHGVCNTPSLARSYIELGGTATHFMPAVDTTVFHAQGRPDRADADPFVLVCYARPGTPRNCFESLAEAFKQLKVQYSDAIQIVTAGQSWDAGPYGLQGLIENLGLLSYAETGALYRAADAGLVAMATRHPSYLPFELMACGAAVVTNRNPHTQWLLKDGENSLLCEMTSSDIVAAVSRLVDDSPLRRRLVDRARHDIEINHSDWNSTCEHIYQGFRESCAAQ